MVTVKVRRILRVVALCFVAIFMRSWYLDVIQHDHHLHRAHKPQRRVVMETMDRAPIYDRFGIPLAVNTTQYQVLIDYAQLRHIPSVRWVKDRHGKRTKTTPRASYIQDLSQMLSHHLYASARDIEDRIHGHAALLPHTPYLLEDQLAEEQYYRLKGQEKDWPGLIAARSSIRHYPLGKVGCGVLGYLGSMDGVKYHRIVKEMRQLEEYLQAKQQGDIRFLPEGFHGLEEVQARFEQLKETAYSLNDLVGKSGIEASYEKALRGTTARHVYEVDRRGAIVNKLSESLPGIPGKPLQLTLSAELQQFAEEILASNEGSRLQQGRGGMIDEKWMRGGSIVAMIPKTGEIVALASYPRFDPNDFVCVKDPTVKHRKDMAIKQWLETESYLGEIWDGKRGLEREYYSFMQGRYIQETVFLTWSRYIEAILPSACPLKSALIDLRTVGATLEIQERGLEHPTIHRIPHEQDRLLMLDLCHLIVPRELFSQPLVEAVGDIPLEQAFLMHQQAAVLLAQIEDHLRQQFRTWDFAQWRETGFASYLKAMRRKEQHDKTYARPYTEYLKRAERKLWTHVWDNYRHLFLYVTLMGTHGIDYPDILSPYVASLAQLTPPSSLLKTTLERISPELRMDYLKTLRRFRDLTTPLKRQHPSLLREKGVSLERHLAMAFYPTYGYGFTRPQAYQQPLPPGSVFKLVVAYETLRQQQAKGRPLNPLTVIDDWRGAPSSPNFILGFLEDGTPLRRMYKGGRMPRSSHPGMGQLDLQNALEQSSNIYFSLLASDVIDDPAQLVTAAQQFGLGGKTGIDLPGESRGLLPNDLDHNRTGLYAFAIGQHTLEATTLQLAVMGTTVANRGGRVRPYLVNRPPANTAPALRIEPPIFRELFHGMLRVASGTRGTARPSVMPALYDHPRALREYAEIHRDMICKTGTAQVLYKKSLSAQVKPVMQHYISFVAIAYPPHAISQHNIEAEPELVVAISLRYRQAGLEGGPIAAQVIKKWRELHDQRR